MKEKVEYMFVRLPVSQGCLPHFPIVLIMAWLGLVHLRARWPSGNDPPVIKRRDANCIGYPKELLGTPWSLQENFKTPSLA